MESATLPQPLTTYGERLGDCARPQSRRWMLRRAGYVLRTEGLRALIRRSAARTVYARMAVLALDLHQVVLDETSAVPLDVQRLRPDQIPAYLRARPDLADGEVERRLARGDWCFVTWTQGQITSSIWFGFGMRPVAEFAGSMDLEPDQAFCYDNWTAPEFRGRNISAAREASTCLMLRDAGFRSLVGHFFVGNPAAMRPPFKLGFKNVAVLTSIRLGWVRWDCTRRADGSRESKLSRHRRDGFTFSSPPALRVVGRGGHSSRTV